MAKTRLLYERKTLTIKEAQSWLGVHDVYSFCCEHLDEETCEFDFMDGKAYFYIPWPKCPKERKEYLSRLGNPVDDTWVDPATIKIN